jgi:hypothetical protein
MRFLPQAAHGSILITSRNGLAARNLTGRDSYFKPMNEEESLTLLRARIPAPQSGDSGEPGEERALVQALEYILLAITQAGSYIANRSSWVTVSRYLQLFRESESNQTHLLQHEDAKDLRLVFGMQSLRHGNYPLSKSAMISRRRRTYWR